MDPKIMELLAQIYQTQTEMRSELKELGAEVKELGAEVKELGAEVKELGAEVKGLGAGQETLALSVAKITTIVEHDVANKIGAIFDFREIQSDHNLKTDDALERIEAKVEVLQIETSHLRRIK